MSGPRRRPTARERTARYLLAVRLEQLREQAAARIEPTGSRLSELAARPLEGDTTGTVTA
ncbi:hypothetical protein [Streptomyces griseus]|uniref:hypothetical protein n=1 Tax=Streptomyces griseus TaxID=1911 RepID=UPI0037BB6590